MAVSAKERKLSLTEAIRLSDIPEGGLSFDEALPLAWVLKTLDLDLEGTDLDHLNFRPTEDGHAILSLEPMGSVGSRPPFRVRGTLIQPFKSDCVRCLKRVDIPLTVQVDWTLLPENEEDEAPLDERTYPKDHVDLPEHIRETLWFELPTEPLCTDQKACGSRTAKLLASANASAEAAFEEDQEAVDPRWAPLLALKAAQEEDPG